jgi:hypothetical protein
MKFSKPYPEQRLVFLIPQVNFKRVSGFSNLSEESIDCLVVMADTVDL